MASGGDILTIMAKSSTSLWVWVFLGGGMFALLAISALWVWTMLQPPLPSPVTSEGIPVFSSLEGRLLFTALDRGKESLWSSALDGTDLQQLFVSNSEILSAGRSNAGNMLVFATQEKGVRAVWRMNAGTSGRQLLFVTSGTPLEFIFSPDDRMMIVEERSGSSLAQREVFLVDLEQGMRSRIAQDAVASVWETADRAVAYLQLTRDSESAELSPEGTLIIRRLDRDRALETPVEFSSSVFALSQTANGELSFLVNGEDGIQWKRMNWQGEAVGDPVSVAWEVAALPQFCQSMSTGWGCLQGDEAKGDLGAGWWINAAGAVQTFGSGWNHMSVQEGRMLLTKDGTVFTLEDRGTPRVLLNGNWRTQP